MMQTVKGMLQVLRAMQIRSSIQGGHIFGRTLLFFLCLLFVVMHQGVHVAGLGIDSATPSSSAIDDGFAFNLVVDGGMEVEGEAWLSTSMAVIQNILTDDFFLFGERARQVTVQSKDDADGQNAVVQGIQQAIPGSELVVDEGYILRAWVFAATVGSINTQPEELV